MTMDEYLFNFFSHLVAEEERLRIHLCEEHLKLMLCGGIVDCRGGKKREKEKRYLQFITFFFSHRFRPLLCDQ